MRRNKISPAAALSFLVLMLSVLFLANCGSGGTANDLPLPVITVSPASASIQAGGSPLQFTATVVSPTSTTIIWTVNNIQGGNSTVGTITTAGLYTAPASVPNPATITVKAVSSAETNPFGAASVTITPPTNAAVTIAPTDTVAPVGTAVQFSAAVTGADNTAVTWYVDGVAGGNSTVGAITTAGLYQAPTTLPSPATVVITATSQADTSQSASTTLTMEGSNTAPLYVNFGLNGNTGNESTNFYNALLTTVSVCLPDTPDCQTVPNVIVDTGSIGLRILNSALTSVPANEFGIIQDSAGNHVQECVQFPDTSYVWGPVLVADVIISGEKAPSVPFQVLGDTTYPVPVANCLTLGAGPALETVQALGANGILGIGNSIQDCGLNCSAGQTFPAYPYYICPQNVCQPEPVPLLQQIVNPVAFFPKDNNGVQVSLPSIPATGAPSLPYINADGSGLIPAGQIVFGVGTQSNNALGSATLYALDTSFNFPEVSYNNVTYNSAGAVDTGANVLLLSNPITLDIGKCTDNPFYCPDETTPVSINIFGSNNASGTVTVNVANADSLLGNSPTFSAFNDLAVPAVSGLGTDQFHLGLPFFFGRTVTIGIAGTTIPNSATAPNGYFAF